MIDSIEKIPSFIALTKNCRKDRSALTPYKLAVMGDCATQHLSKAIMGYAYEVGYNFDVYDADYNQVMAQADISSATLSRVSQCVQYGEGYSKLLK